MSLKRLPLALLLAALGLGSTTAQASVTVSTTTDELTANASCSLREAITLLDGDDATNYGCTNSAVDPTTINVPAKTDPYRLTIHGTSNDTNTTGDLDIYRDMTIAGAGAASTVIDGDHADRVFDIYRNDPAKDPDPTVTISGVTITNGAAPSAAGQSPNGGGIEVYDSFSALTLNNDTVTANAAGSQPAPGGSNGFGGGIYNVGPLSLNATSVDHNVAGPAAVAGDQGGYGGGIYSDPGPLNMTNSAVVANHAGDGGSGFGGAAGGIFAREATITASTISGNGAGMGNQGGGYGGGIVSFNFTVSNSTIANNSAGNSAGNQGGRGGGISSGPGSVTLTNDTIAGNTAGVGAGSSDGFGGGIDLEGSSNHIANSIVASNGIGGNCSTSGALINDGPNLASGDSTCPGFTVGDPNLGPLQDNGGPTKTMAISAPSAALDQVPAGAGCPATDQRGLLRPQGSACDIGAFELVKRYTLSATKTGTGDGSISSAPAAIDCGPTCTAQFDQGTAVTLTANPDSDSRFAGWSGGGCSGTDPCTITVGADTAVIATFKAMSPNGALNTKISKAKIDSDAGTAKFKFGTTTKRKATSGFQCALISKKHRKPKFKTCTSPTKYKHLKPGKYKFEVRAFDAAGTDSSPAKQKFKIKHT